MTTGGTGFTGRDVTPDAAEPLFQKRMDGFSIAFHMLSHAKIGTSTIQSRATAGVAGTTFIFCLPGSPGACRTAGTVSSRRNSITAPGRAISSRSCRGWTNI
jgi:molybdenum cofactor biosynthesis protein B